MNHSNMSDIRGYLVKQLVFFDEEMPLFLDACYPVQNKEKTLMGKSVEHYKDILERLLQLEDVFLSMVINEIVLIESSITICYEDGSHEEFKVVLPSEVDPDLNKISFFSPLGNQLLSKAKGDRFMVKTPEASYPVKVVEIKFG